MLKKNHLILILSFCLSFAALAQKEANWWYFGNYAGVNFNPATPVGMGNGAIQTLEGCASISDRNGNLLFYTDGMKSYTRSHTVMTNGNGLLGNSTSSHSGIIVPDPASPTKFYIFTVPYPPSVGFHYSKVDMTLSSGLGDVMSTVKNVRLMNPHPVTDKVTAVAHANGRDYWVVTQRDDNWNLYAFLVTSAGISATPVVSTVTPAGTGNIPHYGCMKISPDGKKMAIAHASRQTVQLFNFNNSTGACTNQQAISFSPTQGTFLPYGIEFSPNSEYLYVNSYGVIQYDLKAGTIAQINASAAVIAGIGNGYSNGQLQLGPNGKIYYARISRPFLSVINNPNDSGTACNFQDTGIVIPFPGVVRLGLPTFIQSFFIKTDMEVSDACSGLWTKIAVNDTSVVDSVLYNYGDQASGSRNTSWNKLDSHIFTGPGKYVVTAYPFYTDNKGKVVKDTLTDTVDVLSIPIVSLGPDTTVCIFDSLEAMVTNTQPYKLLWDDSTNTPVHRIDSVGQYWVMASNRCGSTRDTIQIDSLFKREMNLGPDTVICRDDSLVLDVSDTAATYLWQDNSTSPHYVIKKPGIYWAKSTNMCGTIGDTIRVLDDTIPTPDLGKDTSFCTGFIFVLDATHSPGNMGVRYKWSDNTPSARSWVRKSGVVWVEVANKCGIGSDTMNVGIDKPLSIDIGRDTIICEGDTIELDPNTQGATCLWNTLSTDSTIKIYQAGTYWLRATNTCGSVSDTIRIETETVPKITLPEDTTKCKGDSIQLGVSYSRSTYKWQDGSTAQTYMVRRAGTYWVEVSNICGMDRDEVIYKYDEPLYVELGADTIMCDNRTFEKTLNLPGNPKYFWSTGSRTNVGKITGGGIYHVSATNVCGVFSDKLEVEQLYKPTPSLGNDTMLCTGEVYKLALSLPENQRRGSEIIWQGRYSRNEYKVNQTGIYRVNVENICGTGGDTIEVEFRALPKVGLPKDTNACDGKLVLDLREYPYQMKWQDGSEKKKYTIRDPGEYVLELTDDIGCYNTERMTAKECPGEFWAPNAFTPNRDGKNETWRVYKENIYDFHIEVYNRWNELVFESDDILHEWNGLRNNTGVDCPVGTYTFKVSYREIANKQFQEEIGIVNIVR